MEDYQIITVSVPTDDKQDVRVYVDGERQNCTIGTSTYYCSGDAVMRTYTFRVPRDNAPLIAAALNIAAIVLALSAIAMILLK